MKTKRLFASFTFGLGLAFLWLLVIRSMTSVYAASYTVTNANASGPGSLRQAILDANGNAGHDTINFDTSAISGAIVLTDALPAIVDDLTISGPGAEHLEISGADAYRVFKINSSIAVTITGVTVRDGYASRGGGIWSAGMLHLDNVRIVDNSAPFGINGGHGGGLYVQGGSTELSGTQVLSNTADCGGGLYVQNGNATLSGTQVAGNTADYGGGLNTRGGTTTLTGTQVTGNAADYGGGVYNDYGSATLNGVQVFSSTASYYGGGVYVRFSNAMLNGTQIAGNTASSRGGGLYVEHGSATLNGGGIADNDAARGSGAYQYRGTITLAAALTVTGDIYQAGGVFAGSTHDLHVVGTLLQAGGHFYAPDTPRQFILDGPFVHTGGTYHQTRLVNDSHDVGFPQAEKGGGVIINANGRDLGSTEVSLSSGADCVGVPADRAVAHCYIITPTLQGGLPPDATITFYYNDSEVPPIQSCAKMEAFRWESSWDNILMRDSSYGIDGRMCGDDPQSIRVTGVMTFASFVLASELHTIYLPLVLRNH